MKVYQAWQNALMRKNFLMILYLNIKCHNFMLVYLAGPQTFLHLCKISDKVNIYLVQVRDVGRSEYQGGGGE